MSFSLGGGSSGSSSKQYVDPRQQQFLDFMRNSGLSLTQDQMRNMDLFGLADQLGGAGQGFLGQLQGNPYMDSLQSMSQYDPGRVSARVDQLGADLGRTFQQNIIPGINNSAIAAGGRGGTREGVAQGVAAQGMADALQRGALGIQDQELQRNLQASTAGGGLAAQSALGGLNSLGSLFQLGMAPFQSQWSPLLNYNQIVGAPTVLGKSSSSAFNLAGSGGGGGG